MVQFSTVAYILVMYMDEYTLPFPYKITTVVLSRFQIRNRTFEISHVLFLLRIRGRNLKSRATREHVAGDYWWNTCKRETKYKVRGFGSLNFVLSSLLRLQYYKCIFLCDCVWEWEKEREVPVSFFAVSGETHMFFFLIFASFDSCGFE